MILSKRGLLGLMIACLSLLLLLGCSSEKLELENTVRAYVTILPEALAKPNAKAMSVFVSGAEMYRIEAYITYNLTQKRLIVNELKRLDIVSVDADKDAQNARVKTKEIWVYHYIDDKSRKQTTPSETISYENTYHLIKTEGRWVVDRIEVKETGGAGG